MRKPRILGAFLAMALILYAVPSRAEPTRISVYVNGQALSMPGGAHRQ